MDFAKLNDSMECFAERVGHNKQKIKQLLWIHHTGIHQHIMVTQLSLLISAPQIPPWGIPHFPLGQGPALSRIKSVWGRALPSAPAWSAPCRAPSHSRSGCPGRRRSPCPACSAASPGWLFPAPSAASPGPGFPVERELLRPHHQQHLAHPRSCRCAQDRSKP